ncbi:hypothetical protein B0H14DRAFT_2801593 [Mycena olivaceomarginata]|nr:hypothetical protein B0H14DRAFT_2801593 [Mycena olivaceomarginata]
MEFYRLGHTTTDAVRQACDAAALRQMQAFNKELALRERRAAEARMRGEPPKVAQAVVNTVTPPEAPELPPAPRTPIVMEQPQARSLPNAKTMSSKEIRPTGHALAPAPAAPAAVKDPPAVRAPIAVKSAQTPLHPIASAVSIQDTRTFGRPPVSAVPAAVKDPPSITTLCAPIVAPTVVPVASKDTEVVEPGGLDRVNVIHKENRASKLVKHFEDVALQHSHVNSKAVLASSSTRYSATLPSISSPLLLSRRAPLALPTSDAQPSEAARTPSALPTSELALAPVHEDTGGVKDGGRQNMAHTTDQPRVLSSENSRTINSLELAKGNARGYHSPRAPSPLSPSSSGGSLSSMVTAHLDSALFSAVLRTLTDTLLGISRVGDAAPCLAWAREGIGTFPCN